MSPLRTPWAAVSALAMPVLLAVTFSLALATRFIGLGGAVTEDEDQWMSRAGNFAVALHTADWHRTFQTGHPGVTTMWLATLVLGPGGTAPFSDSVRASGPVTAVPGFLAALRDARAPFVVLQAVLVVGSTWLVARLFGSGVALIAGLLLAVDPYWAAVGPIVGMDGLLSGFLTAGMLSLMAALLPSPAPPAPSSRPAPPPAWTISRGRIALALVSGACWGLAVLTKTAALLALPLVPIVVLAALVVRPEGSEVVDGLTGRQRWQAFGGRLSLGGWLTFGGRLSCGNWRAPELRRALLLLGIWGSAMLLAIWLLWPAAWEQPFTVLLRAYEFSAQLGGSPHGPGNFFLGQPVDDPGPAFYPVALAFRLGPGATLGLLLVLTLGAPRRLLRPVWMLLGFAVLFLVMLTLAAKKVDRYLLPVLPALDVLAAVGWWRACIWLRQRLGERRGWSSSPAPGCPPSLAWESPHSATSTPGRGREDDGAATLDAGAMAKASAMAVALAAMLALVLQVWPLVAAGRYPLATYNPLFGGARMAVLAIPVGWGDGLDDAADRIRDRAGDRAVITSIWAPLWVNFQAHAPGPVVRDTQMADADYFVDYIDARQRGLTPRSLVRRKPDAVVEIAGVEYARIYRLR
ncbi:MAG: hypothetical protein IT305_15040 [Chloroflexi bacterium]|nr:hypothetical protein [Chloroflexota bacterium]